MKSFYYRPSPSEMSRLRVARGLLNFEKDFPLRLRNLRRTAGLSAESVAMAVSVTHDTYVQWEEGDHLEDVPFAKLADLFGIGMQELVTGEKSLEEEISFQLRTIARELDEIRQRLGTSAPESSPRSFA